MHEIINADILKWTKDYNGALFHACFCDAPYHLTSITERFGKANSAPAQHGRDGAFSRVSRGFQNATWDGGLDQSFTDALNGKRRKAKPTPQQPSLFEDIA